MKDKIKRVIKEVFPYIAIIVVVLFIKSYIVSPIQVKGDSMDPTLKDGDLMILNKLSYKVGDIKRFDIVVIDNGNSNIIKRVIGLPGEVVKFEDNKLYINDSEIEESFLPEGKITNDFEYKVSDNCYFVMGDNRQISQDSRAFGCFDISKIMGRTSLTFFPFDRFGYK